MRVGRYRIDFNAHGLQVGILVCQVFQLGWADKGPVSRVEKEYGPFALYVGVRNFDKLAGFLRLRSERLNACTNDTHVNYLCSVERLL